MLRRAPRNVTEASMYSEDVDIISRCKKGESSAFEQLVEKYGDKAYWIAYDMIRDHEYARDISQEAFVRVFTSIQKFDVKRKFSSWLYRIVVNLCIDHLRSRDRSDWRPLCDDDAIDERSDPALSYEAEEQSIMVNEVLSLLPVKYRTVLTLRDIEGMSCDEIAQILGKPSATVRWRLHRARKLFKDAWERRTARRDR